MLYPTSLPADAAAVAVFEEGMSPEYDIIWSFTYEPVNTVASDEIGFCLFLQDALSAVAGGGVGPDLGFTGTYDLTTKAQPMSGKILGVGFDSFFQLLILHLRVRRQLEQDLVTLVEH